MTMFLFGLISGALIVVGALVFWLRKDVSYVDLMAADSIFDHDVG